LATWSNENIGRIESEKFAYLTTTGRKSGKAHTVELWFSIASEKIFLSHEGEYTDWMRNLARHHRVRIRIGKLTLDADAVILDNGESKELGKRSLYEKYYGPAPKATIDDWFELSTIVELTPLKFGS
jgi:deazaflavin-dependent oxidoreductase (nitroreductase family)